MMSLSEAAHTVNHDLETGTESARLRVLGQELEQKKITDFEVSVETDGYRVRAQIPASSHANGLSKWTFKGLLKSMTAAAGRNSSAEWEQRYSRADLDRLNGWYKTQRRAAGLPDDYSVSQVLRVVGSYVAARRWVLTGVNRRSLIIEITHRDENGQVRTSAQPYAALYDFAIHMHGGRDATA